LVGIVVSVPALLVQRRRAAGNPSTSVPAEPAPVSIRRAEVPFGPFLSASALGYLFLHRQISALIERIFLGG
jgi:prepilin signal peptidase PulO-like enzyme (type II secretory pathway)